MRLNNGTAAGSAKGGPGGGGRQGGRDIRFEISDDLLNPAVDSSDEDGDPSWTPGSQMIGKGVNDLRNGRSRSGTPTSSIHSAVSSVRTRQSMQSAGSRASTSVSQRNARRRRETFAAEEPHPYGLESGGAIMKQHHRGSPSPSRGVRVIEQVNIRRETSSVVYGNGPQQHNVHQNNHNYVENHSNARVTRSGHHISQMNNANNNRSASNHRSAKYEEHDGTTAAGFLSSDSETSISAEDSHRSAVNSSVSYAFSSVGYYLKRFFSSVCRYVYLFIVGTFVFEKWCLHVNRRKEDNVFQEQEENLDQRHYQHKQQHYQSSSFGGRGANGRSYESVSTSELGYQHGDHHQDDVYHMSSQGHQGSGDGLLTTIRRRISNSFWNSSSSTSSNLDPLSEDEEEIQDGSITTDQHHHQSTGIMSSWTNSWTNYWATNRDEMWVSARECFENFWVLFKILLRLLLVILLLALLWNYGSYLLALLSSGAQNLLHGVGSALTVASNGIAASFYFVSTKIVPAPLHVAQPLNKPAPYPSSVKTEKEEAVVTRAETVAERIVTERIIVEKDSPITLAALKSTQETINALKLQIASMEQTLEAYGIRLNAHDDSFKTLQSEVEKIFLAMKAASAKEKSVEQIIDEVLSATVGETTEGDPVSLKGLFSVLKEKEDRDRISEEIEIKLRALSEDVGKINSGFKMEIDGFQTEIHDMNMRVENLGTIVEQHKSVEPEVDIEKLKTVILPILSKEIENSVKISCATRKCPEGLPTGGFSSLDIELMIKRAIAKYDADKTGLPDLALESAGGSIMSTRCTKSSELRNSVISYWGFRLWSPPNTPRTIIQPGVVPGECWAFEGSVGDVVIKLAVPSVVTAFTLEHIPKSISRYGHIDSAPKHFQVLGLQSEHDTLEVHDYGSFTYEDDGEPLQYFPVVNRTDRYYPIVELKILSNHGNMRHTCIYRFRVHGIIDLTRSQNGGGGGGEKTKPPTTDEESAEEESKSTTSNINNSK